MRRVWFSREAFLARPSSSVAYTPARRLMLEKAGVGDGEELHILNTTLAAQLWLPYSLIEVAFRNHADRIISEVHPNGQDWFIASGRDGDSFNAVEVSSPAEFHLRRRDGSTHDPVAEAAEAASTVPRRLTLTRDDLIAHLMLGFWVNRCSDALGKQGFNYYDLISAPLPAPLNDAVTLRKTMRDSVLSMRNRVAHHEPVLFRKRHLFNKDETPRTASDALVNVAQGRPSELSTRSRSRDANRRGARPSRSATTSQGAEPRDHHDFAATREASCCRTRGAALPARRARGQAGGGSGDLRAASMTL